jgi:glycosyltransferase involved in cell wall biosynthesis
MHGPFNPENRKLYQKLTHANIVTISNAQLSISGVNHAGTVYNGLRMKHYPFGDKPGDYLLYVGRFSMEKGVHFAIETAELLDIPLIMAAKLETSVDMPYFHEYIEPHLSERIRWIGEVDEKERNELMSKALAFLHPVTWREPFGLTLIESMACGTPVIAFNLGSIPEIVKNKVTGYVVSGVDEMIEAVNNVREIDRATCREHVLKNFSVEQMTDGYEAIYKKLTNKPA